MPAVLPAFVFRDLNLRLHPGLRCTSLIQDSGTQQVPRVSAPATSVPIQLTWIALPLNWWLGSQTLFLPHFISPPQRDSQPALQPKPCIRNNCFELKSQCNAATGRLIIHPMTHAEPAPLRPLVYSGALPLGFMSLRQQKQATALPLCSPLSPRRAAVFSGRASFTDPQWQAAFFTAQKRELPLDFHKIRERVKGMGHDSMMK